MEILKKEYNEKIVPELMQKFNYTTKMQVPRLEKIVLNMGVGDALADSKYLDAAMKDLEAIGKESIKALRNILLELENSKYITRIRKQDEHGKFYYDYSIYEIPFNINPYYRKGHMVKGYTKKATQINTNKENIKEQIYKDDKTKASFFYSRRT